MNQDSPESRIFTTFPTPVIPWSDESQFRNMVERDGPSDPKAAARNSRYDNILGASNETRMDSDAR